MYLLGQSFREHAIMTITEVEQKREGGQRKEDWRDKSIKRPERKKETTMEKETHTYIHVHLRSQMAVTKTDWEEKGWLKRPLGKSERDSGGEPWQEQRFYLFSATFNPAWGYQPNTGPVDVQTHLPHNATSLLPDPLPGASQARQWLGSEPNRASTPWSSALNHQQYPKPADRRTVTQGFRQAAWGEDMFTWQRGPRWERCSGARPRETEGWCVKRESPETKTDRVSKSSVQTDTLVCSHNIVEASQFTWVKFEKWF